MEPPVLSFYGAEPVPLPPRFAKTKRKLVAGHEAALQASWARLLDALRDEVDHIHSHGPALTPSIDFSDIDDPVRAAAFAHRLKRYGVGVVRRVLPRSDADAYIAETVRYLETTHDFKPPPPQDPTCFDFFWTPAQFAMSLWDSHADDRMATRFPISYADRIRIHGATVGGHPAGTGGGGGSNSSSGGGGSGSGGGGGGATPQGSGGAGSGDKSNDQYHATHASSSTSAASAAAAATARELLGDFTSSTVIAQVDNGSLERWEPDGYGRSGTYDPIFRGDWESYDPWDPTGRGVLALSTIEPGMIRLLPSPKLATAYFLLRPFFSPRRRAPEGRRDGPEWDAYLDASNWELDREQSTIIHGAVPGHAQRLTEVWHPHLQLRRTLVTIPTLQPGDYIMWHPDLAYHITSYGTIAPSRAPTPPPPSIPRDLGGSSSPPPNLSSSSSSSSTTTPSSQQVSVLVYVPAAPLTQNNALRRGGTTTPGGQAETEVARMANIILFPDRYDFYMGGRRNGNGRTAKAERE
ncbi:hypothetical protein VTK73DRAFT_1091 [Phialemonium thermophilum]|uniref:Uncharacterized protein n=1 Tax=Phialemonium thermophilum TaxID=223376 RepID=A0ABR3VTY3_9PEZI